MVVWRVGKGEKGLEAKKTMEAIPIGLMTGPEMIQICMGMVAQ